jgi:hypothetical protein
MKERYSYVPLFDYMFDILLHIILLGDDVLLFSVRSGEPSLKEFERISQGVCCCCGG